MNLLLRVAIAIANVGYLILQQILLLIYCKKSPSLPSTKDPLLTLSAVKLAGKIRQGEITSYELVSKYIEIIKKVNSQLNAVVDDRFEDALIEAKICDEQLRAGKCDVKKLEKEKPLYGVPISVKENCPVKGLSYTGCTLSRKGMKASSDAVVVQMMRDAGAIPLCVTNTPERCGNVDSTNLLYGRTCNPYDVRYSPGGSSGGEGALIGAGASLIGIGSDIGGSVRIPGLLCGVFAHKPSSGTVPTSEHLPPAETEKTREMLTFGPMSRYVEDLSLATRIMSAKSDRDLRLDAPVDVKRLRVRYLTGAGRSCGMLSIRPEIEECILKAAKHLQGCGAHTEKLPITWPDTIIEMMGAMFLNINEGYHVFTDPKLSENIWSEMAKALIGMSQYTKGPLALNAMVRRHSCYSETQMECYTRQGEELRSKLVDLLGEDGILLYPTFRAPTTFPHLMLAEFANSFQYSVLPNVFRLPATHVPMGLNRDGLPIGFQVIAGPYQDRLCLAVAKELETAFGGWTPPPAMES